MGRILDSIYVRGAMNQSDLQTETANMQDRLLFNIKQDSAFNHKIDISPSISINHNQDKLAESLLQSSLKQNENLELKERDSNKKSQLKLQRNENPFFNP